jgi:hypothetical protein
VDVTLLHVVRRGAPLGLEASDWVVYEDGDGWRLDPHGAPPLPPGPIDAAQLHDLVFAADRCVVW